MLQLIDPALIVAVDVPVPVSARGEVVSGAREFDAQRAGHGGVGDIFVLCERQDLTMMCSAMSMCALFALKENEAAEENGETEEFTASKTLGSHTRRNHAASRFTKTSLVPSDTSSPAVSSK